MNRMTRLTFMLSAAALPGLLAGCGGGASTEPTVTVLPSDQATLAQPGGSSDSNAGDSGGPAEGGQGDLRGLVVFQGSPPSLAPLVKQGTARRDGEVCAADMNIPNEELLVNPDGGLANVFIYLDRAPPGTSTEPPSEPAVFDQKGCQFIPHCLLVQAGRTVLVKSDDAVSHNTHTYPQRNNAFNTTIPPNDRDGVPLVYAKAERQPLEVKCDIHPWMRAWHLPLDHAYGAVTAEDGSFEIPELPAGKHEFRIWHELAPAPGFLDRGYEITIKADQTNEVTIEFDRSQFEL